MLGRPAVAEVEEGRSNLGSIMNLSKAWPSFPGADITRATLARMFCRSGVCREKKMNELIEVIKLTGGKRRLCERDFPLYLETSYDFLDILYKLRMSSSSYCYTIEPSSFKERGRVNLSLIQCLMNECL